VFFWGSSAPIGKYLIVTRFDTLIIAQTRTSLTFILLLLFFLLKNRNIFHIELRDVWKFAVLGVVGLSLTNYTYYFTVKEASVATAILVQYSAPVWVVLYSVFVMKEDHLDYVTVISLVVALIGCYFAVTSGSMQNINLKGWAIITGPLSAFTFAYQVLATKQLLKRYPVWTILVYMFGFSAIFWLCINSPWQIAAKQYSAADWSILWMFAIVSILIPQAAFLILGESIGIIQMFGGLLVLGAVGLLEAHPMIMRKMMKVE